MVHTHADGTAALAYIINDVFQIEDDNSLELALENKGCKDIYDLISMSDIEIDSLTYSNANHTIAKLQGALKNKIRMLKRYIMYRYCSGDPIGNDWESITEEKFDIYRTSTYFVDDFLETNPAMNASLLLGKFPCDISSEWKIEVDQHEVISNSDTLSNVTSFGNDLAAFKDSHPQFDPTNLNSMQDFNISIVQEDSTDFFQQSWNYDFEDKNDHYNFPSALYSMEEIIFDNTDAETEQSCQVGTYYLGEMIDVCANKSNIVLGIIKNVLSNMNRKRNVLKFANEDGMNGGNELLTDMAVFEPMSDPICDLQLVIDRGRVNSMQADGE
jgi:hypothetical protein